jgi:hypothetical protein
MGNTHIYEGSIAVAVIVLGYLFPILSASYRTPISYKSFCTKTQEWENIKHVPSAVDVCKLLLLTVELQLTLTGVCPEDSRQTVSHLFVTSIPLTMLSISTAFSSVRTLLE